MTNVVPPHMMDGSSVLVQTMHSGWPNGCHGVQFLRLGHRGYKKIMSNLMTVTKRLEQGILDTGSDQDAFLVLHRRTELFGMFW